jgi:hypothetical protein
MCQNRWLDGTLNQEDGYPVVLSERVEFRARDEILKVIVSDTGITIKILLQHTLFFLVSISFLRNFGTLSPSRCFSFQISDKAKADVGQSPVGSFSSSSLLEMIFVFRGGKLNKFQR